MVDRDGDFTTRTKLEGLVTVVTGKERESTRTANHMVLKNVDHYLGGSTGIVNSYVKAWA